MSWGQNYFASTDWQEILPPKLTMNQIFGFTENQRNGQLFAHIYQLKLNPPTGNITIKFYWLIVYIVVKSIISK